MYYVYESLHKSRNVRMCVYVCVFPPGLLIFLLTELAVQKTHFVKLLFIINVHINKSTAVKTY